MLYNTVWKFNNFLATLILREIILRVTKTAILHFWGTELRFWWFFAFQRAKICKKSKFRVSKTAKIDFTQNYENSTLLSKVWKSSSGISFLHHTDFTKLPEFGTFWRFLATFEKWQNYRDTRVYILDLASKEFW